MGEQITKTSDKDVAHGAYQRAYYVANRERILARQRIRVQANKEAYYAYQREYVRKNRDSLKQRYRRKTLGRYGLSQADYDNLFAAQDRKCAICGSEDPNSPSKRFDVDHDHAKCTTCATGTRDGYNHGPVRALLCRPCNMMLGNARDNVTRLQQAIVYLNKHKNDSVKGFN